MNTWNWIARMLAVPVSTATASCILFLAPSLFAAEMPLHGALSATPVFLIVGAIIGLIVGCPLVCLIDGMFARWTFRYLIFGAVGAVVGWLLLEGAFAGGAWDAVWTNPTFWMDWAPRRVLFFLVIGVMSGLFYMALVKLIDRVIPRDPRTSNAAQ